MKKQIAFIVAVIYASSVMFPATVLAQDRNERKTAITPAAVMNTADIAYKYCKGMYYYTKGDIDAADRQMEKIVTDISKRIPPEKELTVAEKRKALAEAHIYSGPKEDAEPVATLEFCVMGMGFRKEIGGRGELEILFPGKGAIQDGAEMAKTAFVKAKDAVTSTASSVVSSVKEFFSGPQVEYSKAPPPKYVEKTEPAAPAAPASPFVQTPKTNVAGQTTEVQPQAPVTAPQPSEARHKEKPEAQAPPAEPAQTEEPSGEAVPDVTDLASKVDNLLAGEGNLETPISGGTMTLKEYGKALTNPSGTVEDKTKMSDDFREGYSSSHGVWNFENVIPTFDGGAATVDIPTYEELVKWYEEQRMMQMAMQVIGAAIAAGIEASQQQKESGGGGGGGSSPPPQQNQPSTSSCGPCK